MFATCEPVKITQLANLLKERGALFLLVRSCSCLFVHVRPGRLYCSKFYFVSIPKSEHFDYHTRGLRPHTENRILFFEGTAAAVLYFAICSILYYIVARLVQKRSTLDCEWNLSKRINSNFHGIFHPTYLEQY